MRPRARGANVLTDRESSSRPHSPRIGAKEDEEVFIAYQGSPAIYPALRACEVALWTTAMEHNALRMLAIVGVDPNRLKFVWAACAANFHGEQTREGLDARTSQVATQYR